jgi:hypothetical protein
MISLSLLVYRCNCIEVIINTGASTLWSDRRSVLARAPQAALLAAVDTVLVLLQFSPPSARERRQSGTDRRQLFQQIDACAALPR